MREIKIIDYLPEYQPYFEQLNRRWIEQYFEMEEKDYQDLGYPKERILDKGGAILIALCDGAVAGTVALLKLDDDNYKFAKMAVDPAFQRMGIAEKLSYASFLKAEELGAKKIVLYSNSILKPAIALYEKLGFKHVSLAGADFARANVKMELPIEEAVAAASEYYMSVPSS